MGLNGVINGGWGWRPDMWNCLIFRNRSQFFSLNQSKPESKRTRKWKECDGWEKICHLKLKFYFTSSTMFLQVSVWATRWKCFVYFAERIFLSLTWFSNTAVAEDDTLKDTRTDAVRLRFAGRKWCRNDLVAWRVADIRQLFGLLLASTGNVRRHFSLVKETEGAAFVCTTFKLNCFRFNEIVRIDYVCGVVCRLPGRECLKRKSPRFGGKRWGRQ